MTRYINKWIYNGPMSIVQLIIQHPRVNFSYFMGAFFLLNSLVYLQNLIIQKHQFSPSPFSSFINLRSFSFLRINLQHSLNSTHSFGISALQSVIQFARSVNTIDAKTFHTPWNVMNCKRICNKGGHNIQTQVFCKNNV